MRPADVRQVFLGFELRFLVIGNASGEPTGHQGVGNVQSRFISRSLRSEVKEPIPVSEDAFGGPAGTKEMQEISIDGLIAHRIVTIGGRKPLAWSRRGSIHLTVVAKEIADVEDVLGIKYVRDLAYGLVIVVDLQQ